MRVAALFVVLVLAGCSAPPQEAPKMPPILGGTLHHRGENLGWVDILLELTPDLQKEDVVIQITVDYGAAASWPLASLEVMGIDELGAQENWAYISSPHWPNRTAAQPGWVRVNAAGQEVNESLPALPFARDEHSEGNYPPTMNVTFSNLFSNLDYLRRAGPVAHLFLILIEGKPAAKFDIKASWSNTNLSLTYGHGNDTFVFTRNQFQAGQGVSFGASEAQGVVGTDVVLDATLGTPGRSVVFAFEGSTNAAAAGPRLGNSWYIRPDGSRQETVGFGVEVSPTWGNWTFGLDSQTDPAFGDFPSIWGAVIDPARLPSA